MAEQKDVRSSSHAGTQNCNSLWNNHWQENVGSHQKTISHVKGQRSPNKTVGGAKSRLESNPIPARDAWRAQRKPAQQESPQTLSQACLWVPECLLRRHRSAVAGRRGRGSACGRPGSHSVWHKPFKKRSPWTPPYSRQADDRQTAEQLCQRNPHTDKKVLGPTIDFQPGDQAKGLRTPKEYDFGGQWDLITRHLEGTNKTLCAPGPRRKEQWPRKRLTQTCLWGSRSLWRRRGRTLACCRVGALNTTVPVQDLLKEVAIIFINPTIIWSQVK